MISLSPSHKGCEISRTQGNSSCHQAALAKTEETQEVREVLSIIKALSVPNVRNASTLVKQIEGATGWRKTSSLMETLLGFSSVPPLGSSHTGTPLIPGSLLCPPHSAGIGPTPSTTRDRCCQGSKPENSKATTKVPELKSHSSGSAFNCRKQKPRLPLPRNTGQSVVGVWVLESDLDGATDSVATELYDRRQVV